MTSGPLLDSALRILVLMDTVINTNAATSMTFRPANSLAAAAMILLIIPRASAQDPSLDARLRSVLELAASKLSATVVDLGDTLRFPRSTDASGRWATVHAQDWTAGFFPGMLWMVGGALNDTSLLRSAERWTAALEPTQTHARSHDIGFIMFCSYGNKLRVRPEDQDRRILIRSAQTLTSRYHPVIGCIRSWNFGRWSYPVIIDNLMNLELLLWAAENGGTLAMRDIAMRHAERTMENHMRPDGSTWHVVSYDTLTGAVRERVTHQGYADSSAWARGQAWAIYGFTMAHRFTTDTRFLATAQRAADFYLEHLPEDRVPYWDFRVPGIPNAPRDASAAAVAASALIELGKATGGPRGRAYREKAGEMLRSLSTAYLDTTATSRGLLRHATGNMPAGTEIDVSLIYGDYYYVEAALRWLEGD